MDKIWTGRKNMCMCKWKCNCNLRGMSCVGVVGLSVSSPLFLFQKTLHSMWRGDHHAPHYLGVRGHGSAYGVGPQTSPVTTLFISISLSFSAFDFCWVSLSCTSNPMGLGGRIYHILLPPKKKTKEKERKMFGICCAWSVGIILFAPSPCASLLFTFCTCFFPYYKKWATQIPIQVHLISSSCAHLIRIPFPF